MNTDCVDYEGDAKTVHLGKTFVVAEEMEILERAHMVCFYPQVTFVIVATALQKGGQTPIGCRLRGGMRSCRKCAMVAHALGRGARCFLWDNRLGNG